MRKDHHVIPFQVNPSHGDFHGEGGSIFSAVNTFPYQAPRLSQVLQSFGERGRISRRIDVHHGPRQQFFVRVSQSGAGFFIGIEKAKCFWIDHLNPIVALVYQGAEQFELANG